MENRKNVQEKIISGSRIGMPVLIITIVLLIAAMLLFVWGIIADNILPIFAFVYVLIGFGAVGYLWAYIMLRCFKPYLPEEDLHAHDESVLLHEVDEDDALDDKEEEE